MNKKDNRQSFWQKTKNVLKKAYIETAKVSNKVWKKTKADVLWKKIGPKGRFATGAALFAIGIVVPMTTPVYVTGAAIMVNESKRCQRFFAKIRRKKPDMLKKFFDKIKNSPHAPGLLKDFVRKTDPENLFGSKGLSLEIYNIRKEKFRSYIREKEQIPKKQQRKDIVSRTKVKSKELPDKTKEIKIKNSVKRIRNQKNIKTALLAKKKLSR